ncbi:MAG: phosphomethylpyrimidine synthase [Candidatus Altiarchaeales archaeon IMC4]|nr:MAG: phosphomethylpyrimidine synthase [Candidatus Altiarchaeales archaeon IMC4]
MFEELAKREGIGKEKLKRGVKNGSIVIVKNSARDIKPIAIGAGVSTKINANIGVSSVEGTTEGEIKKARAAEACGADTIMDLSTGKDAKDVRRQILKHTTVPLGTVPIYDAFCEKKIDMDIESILKVIEKQCREGVDFMTIHSGITLDIVKNIDDRIIPITSRGGSFIAAWMVKNNEENPLYTGFGEILEILREYDVVASLGDAMRPAAIADATDWVQIQELINLGRLTKTARAAGVGVIIEGPGHVPLDQIEANVKLEKRLCDNAPFYVLGPLVTDIGAGHDHITGAIGGAVAAMHGADFLCYVTPSEHLGLPTIDDVKQGIIASKIAAHAADVVKLGRIEKDDEMSKARNRLDWNKMFSLCIDKDIGATHAHLKGQKECTMCGQYCALKIMKEYLGQ